MPCERSGPPGRRYAKHFHELHNDSTVADIHLAAREGYEAAEHLKRYTTTGMGTDQGKTSNLNALTVLAELRGLPVPAIGVTTFRPPYTPLTFGAVVGHDRRELFLQKLYPPSNHASFSNPLDCCKMHPTLNTGNSSRKHVWAKRELYLQKLYSPSITPPSRTL